MLKKIFRWTATALVLALLLIETAYRLPVMRGLCAAKGYKLPELVTPFELMEALP